MKPKMPPILLLISVISAVVLILSVEIYLNTMLHESRKKIMLLEKKINYYSYEKFTAHTAFKTESRPEILLKGQNHTYSRLNKDRIPIIRFKKNTEPPLHAKR